MLGVIDVILDVVLSIFAEKSNKRIENSSISTVQKNILRVLIIIISLLIILALVYLSVKLFDN